MMMSGKRCCSFTFFLLAVIAMFIGGCSEDCETEHQLCLAKITTSLDRFSYEETCRYPSMNSGDARLFCECEDEFNKCKSN